MPRKSFYCFSFEATFAGTDDHPYQQSNTKTTNHQACEKQTSNLGVQIVLYNTEKVKLKNPANSEKVVLGSMMLALYFKKIRII